MSGKQFILLKTRQSALQLLYLVLLVQISGCTLIASPPARFPESNERKLLGPGQYGLIQWSPDGNELAFIDNKSTSLRIINLETRRTRTLVKQTSGGYFIWDPDGTITYMTYTPGNDPLVYDLHRIDTLTRQDDLLASDLPDVHNFHWLTSGKELLLVMGIAGDKSLVTNVYRMQFPSGIQELLVSSEELGYEYITRIAISPDNSTLAIVGYSGDPSRSSKLVVCQS